MLQPRLMNTRLLPSGSRRGPPAVAGNPRPAGLQASPRGGAGPGASRFLNLNPGIARSVTDRSRPAFGDYGPLERP